MRRVSSSLSCFYKRVGPWIWFGLLAIATGASVFAAVRGSLDPRLCAVPPALALVTYLYMRRFWFALADEIYDTENALVIRNKGREMTVPICRLLSAKYSCIADPPRIAVVFRLSALAEAKVEFVPELALRMFVFRAPPLVADLSARIAAEKSKRASLEPLPEKTAVHPASQTTIS